MSEPVINENILAQIELLETILHNTVAGAFGGNHKSKTFGSSCEFADYRDYVAGDDITKIDWNAFARFEKLYLKLYLDERQVHTRIYIDASKSMAFGKSEKAVEAIRIAAAFAYLSVCENDRVSIYALHGDKAEEVISNMLGKDAYYHEIGKLNAVEFFGDCRLSDAVLSVPIGYGDGLSVLISDFLTENDFIAAMDSLASKYRDLLCVQILSREELHPQQRGKMHLYDSEDSDKYYRRNINKEILRAYNSALEYATSKVRDNCFARGGRYLLASDDQSLGEIFFEGLTTAEVLK